MSTNLPPGSNMSSLKEVRYLKLSILSNLSLEYELMLRVKCSRFVNFVKKSNDPEKSRIWSSVKELFVDWIEIDVEVISFFK